MPRLIVYLGNICFSFGITYYKAVFCAVLGYPLIISCTVVIKLLRVYIKAEIYRISRVMLARARFGCDKSALFFAVLRDLCVKDYLLRFIGTERVYYNYILMTRRGGKIVEKFIERFNRALIERDIYIFYIVIIGLFLIYAFGKFGFKKRCPCVKIEQVLFVYKNKLAALCVIFGRGKIRIIIKYILFTLFFSSSAF